MSFFLSPFLLFLLGFFLAYLRSIKIFTAKQARYISYVLIILIISLSSFLFLDFIRWPVNFDLKPIDGSLWMFHSDITGIYKTSSTTATDKEIWLVISGGWAIIFILLYPAWLWLGYNLAQMKFFKLKLKVIRGVKTFQNVKSRNRVDIALHKVIVKRSKDSIQALEDGLIELGGLENLVKPNDKVVIKVTISSGNPYVKGSFTNPQLVGLLAQKIQLITGDRVKVVDSDNLWSDFERVAKIQGWYQAVREFDFELVNLSKTEVVNFDFGSESKAGTQLVSTLLLDADYIISMPVMKTDILSKVHLSIQSMFECFPENNMSKFHALGLDRIIVDVAKAFFPNLAIIDGSTGGEALGPLTVKSVRGETLIFSKDAVAADSVAGQIMGFNVHDIPYLRRVTIEGIGTATILKDFKEISYSLPTDGIWEKPSEEAYSFYHKLMLDLNSLPSQQVFFDEAVNLLLYDEPLLPILVDLSPTGLFIIADAFEGLVNLTTRFSLDRDEKKLLDQKIGEKIYPKILHESWPTWELEKELLRIGLLGKPIFEYPTLFPDFVEIKDFDEKSSFAERFLPTVSTVGLELLSENHSKAWSGIQYGLVESKGGSLRVLQTILIWTKQKFVFSYFYNILLPILLGIFGIVLISSVKENSQLEGIVSVLLVFGVLWLLGGPILLQFIYLYRSKKEVVIRNPMFFPIYGTLYLIALYDIFDKFSGGTNSLYVLNVGNNAIDINLPLVSIIFFVIAILAGLLILFFGNKHFLASHDMDYAPIWIYLSKKAYGVEIDNSNPVNWELESVCFDAYHYEMGKYSKGELIEKKALKDEHVLLDIDNNWHSFHLGYSSLISETNTLAFIGLLISTISLISLLVFPLYFWGENILILVISVLFLTLMVGLLLVIAQYRYPLVKIGVTEAKESLKEPEKVLTPGKLYVLWNLQQDVARLKIHSLLVEPFSKKLDWKRWDDPEEKEIFTESPEIQIRNKLPNVLIMLFWVVGFISAFILEGYFDFSSNLFIIGLAIIIVGVLLATFILDYSKEQLLVITISTALFAIIEEILFQEAGLGTLSGDTHFIIIFGMPVIIFFLISLFFVAIQLTYRDLERNDRIIFRLLLLGINLFGLFSFLLIPEFADLLTGDFIGNIAVVLILLFALVGSVYFLISSIKNSLPLSIVIFVGTSLVEIIGNLSGIWTYATNSETISLSLNYFASEFPLFIGFLWIFRIAVIFLLLRVLKLDIEETR
ncbi:MAG: DUF362 domain-containing protein [Candidatus Hodarchaeales archaeon]|jgi:uncharacterized protein (DUF362 family)